MSHPKRIETVHVETLNDELCLYDWQRLEVYNLNPTAATVWQLCDGQTSPQQIAQHLKGDLTPAQAEELVWLTLARLERANLLQTAVVKPAGPRRETLTRRDMLKGLGLAAAMLPVVTSIVAPGPVAAQSPGPVTCPIVRTITVGTVPDVNAWTFYPFDGGASITDADIAACNPTTITYSWTGIGPTGNAGIYLAQSNNVQANDYGLIGAGSTPPASSGNPNYWTGNRPYNGVDIDINVGPWNLGVLTITLA